MKGFDKKEGRSYHRDILFKEQNAVVARVLAGYGFRIRPVQERDKHTL